MNFNLGNEGIICPDCGTTNKQGYRFCVKCGSKLPAAGPEPASPAPFSAFEQSEPAAGPEPASPAPFGAFGQPLPAAEPEPASSAPFSAFEQPLLAAEPEPAGTAGFARLGQGASQSQPEPAEKEPAAGFARSGYSGAVTPTAAAGAFATVVDAARNDKKIDISDAETVMNLLEQGEQSALAKGLPDWDVLPPQIVVRRKHRV